MTASWKTVKVFISSTFRDMQAERDHLVRFVFPRLRDELLTRRIHLVDVDLRWGVTGGTFYPSAGKPLMNFIRVFCACWEVVTGGCRRGKRTPLL